MLTHPRKSDGEPNPRVVRVLNQLAAMNEFRRGTLSVDEFQEIAQSVFPHGIVWQSFLFHVTRPAEWPIADQHVFRSYALLSDTAAPTAFPVSQGTLGHSRKWRPLIVGSRESTIRTNAS
jgi:hypothetical protein